MHSVISETPVALEGRDAVRARWAAEAIIKKHGMSSVRHEDHPWVVYVEVRDSAASLEVTRHGDPNMLEFILSGFSGRINGNIGIMEEFLAYCGQNFSRN